MKVLTAAEMREVDRLTAERYGISTLTLMENAGAQVAQFIGQCIPTFTRRQIVVICGKGNNGGDGLVVARHLLKLGAKPIVVLLAAPQELRGDAAANLKRWEEAAGDLRIVRSAQEWEASKQSVGSAEIIVDAVLGTGARGPVEGLLRQVIEDVNRCRPRAQIFSVDIPSGLSADTGDFQGAAVSANYTVTFTAPKLGFFLGAAHLRIGQLAVRDIGSPPELVDEVGKGNLRWLDSRELAQFAIPRDPSGHKGDYGHALIIAGSVGKSGAAVLAGWAALRVGAGLVTIATAEPALTTVAAHIPEVMTEPLAATEAGSISLRTLENDRLDILLKGKRAWAMGPGLSTHTETQQFVRALVGKHSAIPLILDADGLNAFDGRSEQLRGSKGMIALTPHPGELARLLGSTTGDVQSSRLALAQKAAADWGAIVILKGHHTVVAAPGGEVFINATGNPGMGTGGTGDVLTGMLVGLTAQYGTRDWARVLGFGVYLHGLAGDIAYAETGEAPLMASDLIHAIPRAYKRFYAECGRG